MINRPRTWPSRLVTTVLACIVHTVCAAQEAVPGIAPLMRDPNATDVPSAGRVIAALLITIAVGVAAVMLLRRLQPKLGFAASSHIKVIDRGQAGGCRLWLLIVDGERVLLSERGTTSSMIVLPPKSEPSSGSP